MMFSLLLSPFHVCVCARQAAESIQAEDESAKLCKRRIEHLKEHSSDQPASVNLWKKKRMDRMMVEHLLRCGYYNTAVKLARQSGIEVPDSYWTRSSVHFYQSAFLYWSFLGSLVCLLGSCEH